MSKPLNVLISGSGIAGSVFASCLLHAYKDATITVVERAPSFRLTGASFDIRSSAVDIIKWMGVERQIRKHATNEEGIAFVGASGRPIATFRATGRSDIHNFTSEYEIFRGALAKILIEPVADRVILIFNESVDQYEQGDEVVLVTFASQRKESYDLLVATDRLRSELRSSMLNKSPHEQIHDEGVHAAY